MTKETSDIRMLKQSELVEKEILAKAEAVEELKWHVRSDLRELSKLIGDIGVDSFVRLFLTQPF